ncbi:MAG: hypothetical protein ACLR1P_10210 [Oscillospiraceae bacterium]
MQHAGVDSCRENAQPEMKKRKVSIFYTGLFGFTSILFSILTTIFVWIFIQCIKEAADSEYDVVFVLALLPVVVGVIGLLLSIYMVLKGAFSAAYMVDAEGMTTYWQKNTYRLLWTDCVEFEIVQVPVNWSTSAAVVYCSTRVLSQKEKENFFWYHKNDFAHVQYFQYSDEAIFQEFLHCVPERARNYLEAEALVLGLPGE